ncbi:UBX domain-containing protein 4-like [Oppia nitens]|uniref:UBX domain-containing protein 4-like n=1 Tax=Oppia nitens TaxID=1686743 RepID=UPI0023DAC826|nr:UBX domain-containing protein 4-like [Oppia nitens]
MFWFTGSVNEAIIKSKNEKKVFVVFIKGEDERSIKMNAIYDSLSTKLSELPIIGLKLDSQSDNCRLFSQIYPILVIPSTYFIDAKGIAIEIIADIIEDTNVLMEKINKTIDIFNNSLSIDEIPNQMQTSVSSHTPVANNLVTNMTTNNNDSTSSFITTPTASSSTTESSAIDSKVERANQLIEAIRQKKAKEEEDRERKDEIERRTNMKEMLNQKRIREDKEALEAIQERERDKREEKLARQRVLAQIAADREDRKAKFQTSNEKTTNVGSNESQSNVSNEQQIRHRNDTKARIQFKLPDGSTRNNIFEANDTLETVRQYVSSNLNIRSFSLVSPFPRKEFSNNEYNETLSALLLTPSSVILVVPKSGSNISRAITSPSIVSQLLTYLFTPFVMLWSFVTNLFGSNTNSTSNQTNANIDPNTSNRRPERVKPKQFYNRDGNVARISGKEDDSDDNNTYNGNSTQQM